MTDMPSGRQRQVLQDHSRRGKTLIPPWAARVDAQVIQWEDVYIPEHLWLAYLMRDGDVSKAAELFNEVCNILDSYYLPHSQEVFLGYVSDFSRIPSEKRPEVVTTLCSLDSTKDAFGRGFRAMLCLYPRGPAGWLAAKRKTETARGLGLSMVSDLVASLRVSRSKPTVQCRMLGLNRLLKHEKIHFSSRVVDDSLARGLASYPFTDEGTSDRVEQFVRMNMNMVFSRRTLTDWRSQFWKTNFTLFRCR